MTVIKRDTYSSQTDVSRLNSLLNPGQIRNNLISINTFPSSVSLMEQHGPSIPPSPVKEKTLCVPWH